MESAYPRRNASRESPQKASSHFLSNSRLHPRGITNPRQNEDLPRTSTMDARLATVYDKMKVLATFSEEVNPNLAKSSQWKETVNEIDKESQRFSSRASGFTQVTELLSQFQADIFETLKLAKRVDEISLKAKLWESFNALSNNLWSSCFKNRTDEAGLAQENRHLRNTLDQMEEQILRLKGLLQEKDLMVNEAHGSPGWKAELKRVKEFNKDLQMELNQKIAMIQSQEQQLSILRHELRNKEIDPIERRGGVPDDIREKILKITQERDALKEWKSRFTQYPSTYEKAIQRIKEEHQIEKNRLQESIEQLQSLISDTGNNYVSKTTSNFFPQGSTQREKIYREPWSKSPQPDRRLKDSVYTLKKENSDIKDKLDMVINDYDTLCDKFKIQSEQFDKAKAEYSKTIESLKRKISEVENENEEILRQKEQEHSPNVKPGGISKGKKGQLRSGKGRNDDKEFLLKEIENLEKLKEKLEEDKKNLESTVENDKNHMIGLTEQINDLTLTIEQQKEDITAFTEEKVILVEKHKRKLKELDEKMKRSEGSEKETYGLSRKLEEKEKEYSGLLKKIADIEENNRILYREKESIRKILEEKESELEEWKQEFENMKDKNKKIIEDLKLVEDSAKFQTERYQKDYIKVVDQAKTDAADKAAEISKLQKLLANAQDELIKVTKEKAAKDKETGSEALKIAQLSKEKVMLSEKLKELSEKLEINKEELSLQMEELERNLVTKTQECNELNTFKSKAIQQYENIIEEKTQKLKDLEKSLKQVEADNYKLIKSLENYKKREKDDINKSKSFDDEKQALVDRVEKLEQDLEEQQRCLLESEENNEERQETIRNMEEKIELYENDCNVMQQELTKVKSELQEYQAQLKQKSHIIETLENSVKTTSVENSQIKQLQDILELCKKQQEDAKTSADKTITQGLKEIEALRVENNNLKNELIQKTEEFEELLQEFSEKDAALQEADLKIEELTEFVQEKSSKIEGLEKIQYEYDQKLKYLHNMIEEKADEIEDQKLNINDLKSQKEKHLNDISNNQNEMQNAKLNFTNTLNAKKQKIQTLKQLSEEKDKQISEHQLKSKKTENKAAEFQKMISTLKEQYQKVSATVGLSFESLQKLCENSLNEKETLIISVNNTLGELKTKFHILKSSLLNKLSVSDKKNHEVSTQLLQKDDKIRDLSQKLSDTLNSLSNSQVELDSLNKKNSSLLESLKRLESEKFLQEENSRKLHKDIENLEASNKNLLFSLESEMDSKSKSLIEELQAKLSMIHDLEQKVKEQALLLDQNALITTENSQLAEKLKALTQASEQIRADLSELTEKNHKLESSNNKYKEREQYTREVIEKHEKENIQLQNEIDTNFQEVNHLRDIIKKLKDDSEDKQKSVELLKKIDNLNKSINEQNEVIKNQNEVIEDLNNKISQESEINEENEEKIEELNNEKDELMKKIGDIGKLYEDESEMNKRLCEDGLREKSEFLARLEESQKVIEELKKDIEIRNEEIEALARENVVAVEKDEEIEELSEKVSGLEDVNRMLNLEIEGFIEKIQDLEKGWEQEKENVESLQEYCEKVDQEIEFAKHKCRDLEIEEDKYRKQCEKWELECKVLNEKRESQEEELEKWRKQSEDQKYEFDELQRQYNELKASLEKLSLLKAELDSANTTAEQQKIEIDRLVIQNSELLKSKDQIISLSTEISHLQGLLKSQESEFNQLKTAYTQQTASLESLKSECSSKDSQIHSITSILNSQASQLEDLQQKLKQKSLEIDSFINTESTLQQKISALQRDIASKDEELIASKKHTTALSESLSKSSANESLIKSFQTQIDRLRSELEDKDLEFASIQAAFGSQKEFLKIKEEEAEEIKKKHNELTEDYLKVKSVADGEIKARGELEKKFAGIEREKNEISAKIKLEKELIKSKLQDAEEENAEFKDIIKEYEEMVENYEKDKTIAKMDIERINLELIKKEQEIKELTKQNMDLIQEIEELKAQNSVFVKEIEKLDLEMKEKSNQFTEINKIKEGIESQTVNYIQSIAELNKNHETVNENCKALKINIIGLEETIKNLQITNSSLTEEISKINSDLHQHQQELQKSQSLLKSEQESSKSLSSQIKNLTTSNTSLQSDLEKLQKDISSQSDKIKSLQNDLVQSTQSFEHEKSILKSQLQQSAEDSSQKCKDLTSQLLQKEKSLEEYKKDLDKSKSENASLIKKQEELEYFMMQSGVEKSGLEKSKSMLESQKHLLSQEVESLQVQIKAYTEEITRLSDLRAKELKEKNLEIQELKKSLSDKNDELRQIENELHKMSNLPVTEEAEGKEQSGTKSLWKHIDQLNKQIEEKTYMISQKDTVINNLNIKIDEAHEAFQIVETTKQTLELKLKSAESSDLKLKNTIASLQDDLDQLQAEKKVIEETLGKEILDLKSQKKNLEKLLIEEKEKLARELENANEEHLRIKLDFESLLKSSAEKNDDTINRLINDSNVSIARLESKIQELERELAQSSYAFGEKESEIKSLSSQLNMKNQMYQDLQSDFESSSKLISDYETSQKSLQESNNNFSLTIDSYKRSTEIAEKQINDLSSQILEYEEDLRNSQKSIEDLKLSLNNYEHSNQDLLKRLQSSELSLSTLQHELKTLESEKTFLLESNKNLSRKSVQDSENEDFEKDIEFSLDDHDKKEHHLTSFNICKVVKHDNKTWCLVYVKNQNPEYNWYEKYVLQEINSNIEVPGPYEEILEKQIEDLNYEIQNYSKIREMAFPEELRCESIADTIESLLRAYLTRKSITRPLKVISYDEQFNTVPISNLSPIGTISSNEAQSDSSMQVTAEEAKQFFDKMKKLEEENVDLENRIMLLTQQLSHFKTEGRGSSGFSGRAEATVDQLRGVIVSILEALPIQIPDTESKIKVVMEIMNVNKEAQERLNTVRIEKNSPQKSSAFKKLFSKKKK